MSIIKKIIKSYAGKTIQVAKKYPDIEYDDKKKIYHLVDVSLSPSPQNFLCIYTPQVKNENVQEVQF